MELYERFIELVDANITYCLIPMVLTLLTAELLFKKRFETKKALNLIRWFIILYTILSLLYFFIGIITMPEEFAFTQRAAGPYKITYWFLFVLATALPFTLLNKKLSNSYPYTIFVAFCMKIGMFFERFVIIVASLHRGYDPLHDSHSFWNNSFVFGLTALFLQGLIIAILLLGVFEILKQRKQRLPF